MTEPSNAVNRHGDAPMLSLNSGGWLEPRGSRDDGAQTSSDSTTARSWLVAPGDLVLNPMWLVGGGVAVSSMAGAVSPDYRVFKVNESIIDLRYLQHLLRSGPYRDQYSLYTRADTTFDRRVSRTTFAALPVLTPPLDTQRRIADMLDAETARIDTLIEKNGVADQLVRRRLDASISHSTMVDSHLAVPVGYLAHVVTSGIDKHVLPGERPVRLCNYTDVYYGTRIGPETTFTKGSCTEQEFARLHLRPGDVVATKDSETADDIGRPAIISVDLPDLVLGYHNVLFRVHDPALEPEFLYWWLRSRSARDYLALKARGVTRVGLRSEDVAALSIPLAPLDVQRAIVGRLWQEQEAVDALCRKMQRQVELLRLRRQALITAAVSGEIEI